nr:hypothetical protein [Tanacetum cinerariifolium]
KKQKVDDNKEELKKLIEIIPNEEEVAIDAIPLAVKSPKIVFMLVEKTYSLTTPTLTMMLEKKLQRTCASTSSATSLTTSIVSKRGISTPKKPFPALRILAKTFWVKTGEMYLVGYYLELKNKKNNKQVNCDETNFRCNERVMDGNSNDDLNNPGEMDYSDEKVTDVCLDKGDDVIPLEGVGESVNKQFEKNNELE